MTDVQEIVLEGPGKNALGTALMESVLARMDAAGGSALLFTGAGDVFSAGLNLKEIASLDAAGMGRFVRVVERLMQRIFDHPGPVVAALNGHAIAGGCVLALCADHRVCTDDARTRIGLNEVALGLVFPPKIARIVKDRVPPRSIHEVVLRGALVAPGRCACASGSSMKSLRTRCRSPWDASASVSSRALPRRRVRGGEADAP